MTTKKDYLNYWVKFEKKKRATPQFDFALILAVVCIGAAVMAQYYLFN